LIDASTGGEMWSERWDRPGEDLFAVQADVADRVARTIVGNAGSDLGPIKIQLLAEAKKRPVANLTAYDFYLLGREQSNIGTKEANAKGLEYAEKAIALDPDIAHAYALRAWMINRKDQPWETKAPAFERDMRQALSLDPSQYSAQAGLMMFYAMNGQWSELSAQIERALRDNPTNTLVLNNAALQLAYLGKPEEALTLAELNLRLDPNMPRLWLSDQMAVRFFARKFERAVELGEQVPEDARNWYTKTILAASYALLGRSVEADRAKASLISHHGEQVLEVWFNEGEVFFRQTEQDLEREAFRKLGFRICATPEELKKYASPKRLPECVKS
jgi:Flp pilus assembly protein TadD